MFLLLLATSVTLVGDHRAVRFGGIPVRARSWYLRALRL